MTNGYETPTSATKSGDIAASCPVQETVAVVESDGDGVTGHRPGAQPFGRCGPRARIGEADPIDVLCTTHRGASVDVVRERWLPCRASSSVMEIVACASVGEPSNPPLQSR